MRNLFETLIDVGSGLLLSTLVQLYIFPFRYVSNRMGIFPYCSNIHGYFNLQIMVMENIF